MGRRYLRAVICAALAVTGCAQSAGSPVPPHADRTDEVLEAVTALREEVELTNKVLCWHGTSTPALGSWTGPCIDVPKQ
jgi:hypothetical protein